MNILETIIASKRLQVEKEKKEIPLSDLKGSAHFQRTCFSLKKSLADPSKTGIIAEFKRKSPSKGIINANASAADITGAYTRFGAAGLSVLTETQYFGGSLADFQEARHNQLPILQKDFIIDSFQLYQAKAIGADLVLLIAACLSPEEVKELAAEAKSLGMEVLLELHAENELGHVCADTELIGINNRDLKTFQVDINRSIRMAKRIPANKTKIAESGIDSVEMINLFRENGFQGFLIGENFMKQADPARAFQLFTEELKISQAS